MNSEEFVKEQMKLSKEDIIANYWYTYQDNVERLGIERQLKLKDKEIERLKEEYMMLQNASEEVEEDLQQRINKAIEYIEEDIKGNYFKRYDDEVYKMCDDLLEILKGDEKE